MFNRILLKQIDSMLELADVQHNLTQTIDSMLELADVQHDFTRTIDSIQYKS